MAGMGMGMAWQYQGWLSKGSVWRNRASSWANLGDGIGRRVKRKEGGIEAFLAGKEKPLDRCRIICEDGSSINKKGEIMKTLMMMVMMTMAWPVFGESVKLYHKGKFLGNVTNNPLDADSINNPIGRYGSRYSPDSINNPYGRYGSRYSIDSPSNPHSYLADSPLADDYADEDYLDDDEYLE